MCPELFNVAKLKTHKIFFADNKMKIRYLADRLDNDDNLNEFVD